MKPKWQRTFIIRTIFSGLVHSPNKEEICSSIKTARKIEERKIISNNLKTYFGTMHSKGVLFVEREFGEDSIVSDLRRHIFETFVKVQFVS